MAHEETIARFSVERAGKMTDEGRALIADWLRMQAENLEADGHNYSDKFRARYLARVNDDQQELSLEGQG